MLVNILLDAKVDSVAAFHRAPLPEERGVTPTPTPKPTPVPRQTSAVRGAKSAKLTASVATAPSALLERNVVNFTFMATPSAARKVLNDIVSSTGQFFIIRTLYVRNEKDKGPAREKTAEANQSATETGLNFIVGNEHIEVSATIEMVRFMF
jgi:hypothetical protein